MQLQGVLEANVEEEQEDRHDTTRRNTGTQDWGFPDHLDPGIASR
jgi:hypothetical protein